MRSLWPMATPARHGGPSRLSRFHPCGVVCHRDTERRMILSPHRRRETLQEGVVPTRRVASATTGSDAARSPRRSHRRWPERIGRGSDIEAATTSRASSPRAEFFRRRSRASAAHALRPRTDGLYHRFGAGAVTGPFASYSPEVLHSGASRFAFGECSAEHLDNALRANAATSPTETADPCACTIPVAKNMSSVFLLRRCEVAPHRSRTMRTERRRRPPVPPVVCATRRRRRRVRAYCSLRRTNSKELNARGVLHYTAWLIKDGLADRLRIRGCARRCRLLARLPDASFSWKPHESR